jgi:hypothetical protein
MHGSFFTYGRLPYSHWEEIIKSCLKTKEKTIIERQGQVKRRGGEMWYIAWRLRLTRSTPILIGATTLSPAKAAKRVLEIYIF